jgi:hypothetical protein
VSSYINNIKNFTGYNSRFSYYGQFAPNLMQK